MILASSEFSQFDRLTSSGYRPLRLEWPRLNNNNSKNDLNEVPFNNMLDLAYGFHVFACQMPNAIIGSRHMKQKD